MDTTQDFEDLPSITLYYNDKEYTLFSPKSKEDICFFGAEYKPETIDIPLDEGDQYNYVLFDSSLYYTILELKYLLEIGAVDVSIELPTLELTLHQDLLYVKKLSVYDLYNMHMQLLQSKGLEKTPLVMKLIKVPDFNHSIRTVFLIGLLT